MDHTLRTADLEQLDPTHRANSRANLPKLYLSITEGKDRVDDGGNHNAR